MTNSRVVDYFRKYSEIHAKYTKFRCINDTETANKYYAELKDLELKILFKLSKRYYGTNSCDVFNELKRKADLYDSIKEITDD